MSDPAGLSYLQRLKARPWQQVGAEVFHGVLTLGLTVALFLPAIGAKAMIVVAIAASLGLMVMRYRIRHSVMGALERTRAEREEASRLKHHNEELFAMTDMLQAAEGHEDAGSVLEATASRLLPSFAGALYVFNNSRDRLDLVTHWNTGDLPTPNDTLIPGHCWGLKRGKPHINDPHCQTLVCSHHAAGVASVEVPMMARGQIYGLLVASCASDEGSFDRLMEVRRVCRALADSMSLALSNISLREKLRTQSLRDPLTGLYNRRYIEDVLERYICLGERTGQATSVIMLDLDNFKTLNDVHGHAMGDTVLRDVASQLVGALRPSDVVARYGGEELLVILPGCDQDGALVKGDLLRERIETLSEIHGAKISASLGVATVPESASGVGDVVALADAALYQAKADGKNCVRMADRRGDKEEAKPRLVV
ncbi:diguanylate cyclase [Erythrobacter sp. 3-20A1M]|uniref:GGDEF domain-containing protein n=1 Tax=Erythrobacter sp. 3-20A1M TaxID=2653850 RepID=UPI001BFC6841|nr:sensor domain-containing diguanylate cyclase [Erythrobacter sp. 3-20A1M]QWC56448.1 diguanylate cyclase [Erythrobacter sp. 3-20A1M]